MRCNAKSRCRCSWRTPTCRYTNHLERALRVIPMGRKNWLFCWSETGAEYVGIIQSLLTTCKLHGVHPYDYLVDVLQRVGQHPASKVHQSAALSVAQGLNDLSQVSMTG